jgi:hypothetical protein
MTKNDEITGMKWFHDRDIKKLKEERDDLITKIRELEENINE